MQKLWKDIKVGDVMLDGSIVTQIHRKHVEECCKLTYDYDRDFICSYRHILLIDVSNLPKEGKDELAQYCTFVPLEESYSVECDEELTIDEKFAIDCFCRNQPLPIGVTVTTIEDGEVEIYDFHFPNNTNSKRVSIKNIITKSEPQKVDDNTYWLTCRGIEYLMNKYNVDLYCNDLLINKIESIGDQECFCISTNTGRYET